MKRLLLTIAFLLSIAAMNAQELKANLNINTSQVQGTNKSVFEALEQDLKQFINDTKWTDMTFRENEKIDCNFALIVNSYTDGLMMCEMQISASRPVYGTSYTTTLFMFRDVNVNFHYQEFDRLELDRSSYDNNLTAIIAYYAYIIIGCDLDSYSLKGGTNMFTQAEQIVNTCQSKSDENEVAGWPAFERKTTRNRYALVNNLLDMKFEGLREFYYEYHRLALDNMAKNVDNARARIAEKMPMLRQLNRENPNAVLVVSFTDAKNDELINIFKKGTPEEKDKVYDSLTAINPTLTSRYDEIKTEK
ncbi:MAG: DUF4835 family protein [Paludibacteraceae bacterium]|nr:DUF4835 family protein [Paludibacteraceae bacterium]